VVKPLAARRRGVPHRERGYSEDHRQDLMPLIVAVVIVHDIGHLPVSCPTFAASHIASEKHHC
jgi:hypothetical protein